MRLVGQIHVTVRGDIVKRDPSLWERLRSGLGGQVNLETGEMQNELEATTVVDVTRRALGRLGVNNALSLVIDDTVIYSDVNGRPDDFGDVVLAMSEHSSVFGRGFKELRFAAEHEEAGVHFVAETRARTKHLRDEPAAIISLGGRIRALEPKPSETAEAYQARVEPLVKQAGMFETARLSFESFVARLATALTAAMPDARVVVVKTEARLVKAPTRDAARTPPPATQPLAPGYDPFMTYYPSPMGMMLDVMLFSSMMHMMMPPPFMLYSPAGAPIATLADVQADPQLASDESVAAADDNAHNDWGASDNDHGGDGGNSEDNQSVWDSDSGGYSDGGDSGGGFSDGGGDFGGGGFD